ncbi:MlrC C-terminal domain-containing protein, partial [Acinetobacter baumannii]
AEALAAAITAREGEFLLPLLSPDEAVATAMRQSNSASRTIVLADVQDNSGAGGTSDTTGVLRALIEGGARDAVIGHLVDPAAAQIAH